MKRFDFIAIIDIKDAYRAIFIHPSDRPRQGILWDFGDGPQFYLDNHLSMGLSSSPYIFSKISDFVIRCGIRAAVPTIVNYLDDFAVLGDS